MPCSLSLSQIAEPIHSILECLLWIQWELVTCPGSAEWEAILLTIFICTCGAPFVDGPASVVLGHHCSMCISQVRTSEGVLNAFLDLSDSVIWSFSG